MKILSLCLALVFVLGAFTGCGGKGEEETTTQAPEKKIRKRAIRKNAENKEEGAE